MVRHAGALRQAQGLEQAERVETAAPAPAVWKTAVLAVTRMTRKWWLLPVSHRTPLVFSEVLIYLSHSTRFACSWPAAAAAAHDKEPETAQSRLRLSDFRRRRSPAMRAAFLARDHFLICASRRLAEAKSG